MNHFVIQHHILADSQHWDLMLEQPEALATWQVSQPPDKWADQFVKCRRLRDHRKAYLTYEGVVSGNRGQVRIVCRGEYNLIEADDLHWQLDLLGDTLRLKINLKKTTEEPDSCEWILAASSLSD